MASARSASLNGVQRGPGAEPLVGVRGQGPLKLKVFCTFLYKKWPKIKDLSENLPPCLSRAAMTALSFGQWGGGRPVRP